MTYEVVDVQNISVQANTGEVTAYLILKVEYTDADYHHIKTFELDPAISDEEITNIIVEAGSVLKQQAKRDLKISGTI